MASVPNCPNPPPRNARGATEASAACPGGTPGTAWLASSRRRLASDLARRAASVCGKRRKSGVTRHPRPWRPLPNHTMGTQFGQSLFWRDSWGTPSKCGRGRRPASWRPLLGGPRLVNQGLVQVANAAVAQVPDLTPWTPVALPPRLRGREHAGPHQRPPPFLKVDGLHPCRAANRSQRPCRAADSRQPQWAQRLDHWLWRKAQRKAA